MQTLMHQRTRTWRIFKVVLVPLDPAKTRKGVNITLEDPLLQEVILQVATNIIKESQGEITTEVHQDNPHIPGIKLYSSVIVTLVQILGTWETTVGHTTKRTLISSLEVKV